MASYTTRGTSLHCVPADVFGHSALRGVMVGSVLLGLAAGMGPGPTLLLAPVAAVMAATVWSPDRLGRYVLALVIVAPSGGAAAALWRPQVTVFDTTFDVMLLLPALVIALTVALAVVLPKAHSYELPKAARVLIAAVALWLGAGIILAVEGALNNGLSVSLLEFEYVLQWGWCAVPLLAFARGRPWSLHKTLGAVVLGSALYSAAMIMFAVAPVGLLASAVASSGRVGFSNGGVLPLTLPLALCLAASPDERVMSRWVAALAGTFMTGALVLSQSRVFLAAALVNCLLVWFVIGRPGRQGARERVATTVIATVAVLTLVLVLLFAAGVPRLQEVPSQLAQRFFSSSGLSQDGTLLVRQYTNDAAFARWGGNVGSLTRGSGLGTLMGFYSPYGRLAYNSLFVDNVWAILAVKGGLLALASFAALLAVVFWALVRAARRAVLPLDRRVWRAVAVSFPVFLVSSTLFTSHLYGVSATVLTVASLGALASLERGASRRCVSARGIGRGGAASDRDLMSSTTAQTKGRE